MKVDLNWQRTLNIALNPWSVKITEQSLYVTERHNRLSKIDIRSGKTVWSTKVAGSNGYLNLSGSCLFYLCWPGILRSYSVHTGELTTEQEFKFPHLGYVEVSDKKILTGGWRGYSDIRAYDLRTRKTLWSNKFKTGELQRFCIPYFLDNNHILTVNHSTNSLQVLDALNGQTVAQHTLPDDIISVDLGRSFRILKNEVTFLRSCGKLVKLNTNTLSLTSEDLPLNETLPNIPCYFDNEMIVRDSEQTYSLIDRSSQKIIWQIPIEHNNWVDVLAAKVTNDFHVIGGGQGTMKLISRDGKIQRLKSEKRITTPLNIVGEHLIYGTKSSVQCYTLT